jgi:Flp pilus assembly protein TadG
MSAWLPSRVSDVGRTHADEGVAAVELAILLPVLLALILATVDFGLAFRQQIMLRNAASNAASYAAVQPCDTTGIDTDATNELQSVSVLKPAISTPQIVFTNASGAVVTDCLTATQVQVTVSAPYTLLTGTFLHAFFGVGTTLNVSGQETVRIQGKS